MIADYRLQIHKVIIRAAVESSESCFLDSFIVWSILCNAEHISIVKLKLSKSKSLNDS